MQATQLLKTAFLDELEKIKTAHSLGQYGHAAMHGVSEELPTALGAMGGLAVGKMIELKTGRKLNPIATSGVGYGVGGLADALLRKHQ